MKKIIIVLFLLVSFIASYSQAFVNRSTGTTTPNDPFLSSSRAFYMPRLTDTTLNGGLDSIGALMYDRLRAKIAIRDTVLTGGHKWTFLLKQGDVANVLANNGVSKSGDTIQLGQIVSAIGNPANLNINREIPLNGFSLSLTGSGSFSVGAIGGSNPKINSVATGGFTAIGATAVNGTGINVSTTGNGTALFAQTSGTPAAAVVGSNVGTSGYGVQAVSSLDAAHPFLANVFNTNNTSSAPVAAEFRRNAQGGGIGDGIGMTLLFDGQTTSTTNVESGQIRNGFSTVSHSSRSSFFEFWLVNNTVSARKALLSSTGQWTWDGYASNFSTTDTSFNTLVVDNSGNIFKRAGSGGGSGINAGYGISINLDTVKVDTIVVDARYRKVFNVKLFGAIGDSVTDDCNAVKAALAAAIDSGGGIVYFPRGHYRLGCPLTRSQDGIDPKAQIVLPLTQAGAGQYPFILFEGEAPNNWTAELITTQPKNEDGTIIESSILDTGFVFGSSYYFNAIGGGNVNFTWMGFNNLDIRVRTKTGSTEINNTMSGIDALNVRSFQAGVLKITIQSQEANMIVPYDSTWGIRLPHNNNNANITIYDINVSGFANGILGGEHMNINEATVFNCKSGLRLNESVHSGYIGQYTSEGCINHITITDVLNPGATNLHINSYNAEHFISPGAWNDFQNDIFWEDPGGSHSNVLIDFASMVESGTGRVNKFINNNPNHTFVGFIADSASKYLYPHLNNNVSTDSVYHYQVNSPSNAGNDGNIFELLNNRSTIGLTAGSGVGLGANNHAYIGMRGTNYTANSSQRGNVYIGAGLPTSPNSNEGIINLFTNGTSRFRIGNDGSITLSNYFTSGSIPFINSSFVLFQDNSNFFWDNSNKRLGLLTSSPSYTISIGSKGIEQYTSASTNDAIKIIGTSGGATFGIENLNSSGFSGIEYMDQTGATKVFSGFNNGNGQEYRFNNLATGGYVSFLTGGNEKMRINNSGGISLNRLITPPSTYNILVHGLTDSIVYQIPSSTFSTPTSTASQIHDSLTTNNISYGTYTPTLTNSSNIDASTAYQCQWMRVGNVVTVSGKIDIDPTSATTLTILGISLPITSAIGNDFEAGGTAAAAIPNNSGAIKADATNDRAQLDFTSGTDVANRSWFFSFTYLIIPA